MPHKVRETPFEKSAVISVKPEVDGRIDAIGKIRYHGVMRKSKKH